MNTILRFDRKVVVLVFEPVFENMNKTNKQLPLIQFCADNDLEYIITSSPSSHASTLKSYVYISNYFNDDLEYIIGMWGVKTRLCNEDQYDSFYEFLEDGLRKYYNEEQKNTTNK